MLFNSSYSVTNYAYASNIRLKIKSQISDNKEKIWSFILRMIFKISFILLINVDSFGGELPFVTYRRIRRITRDEGLRLSAMINETNRF